MSAVVIGIEIIALLACAAFFSGAETAVTALTRADYRSLKKSSRKSAQRLARLVELKDKIGADRYQFCQYAQFGTHYRVYAERVRSASGTRRNGRYYRAHYHSCRNIPQGSRCGTAGIHRESGIASIILVLSAAAAARCGVFAVDARRPETFKRTIA